MYKIIPQYFIQPHWQLKCFAKNPPICTCSNLFPKSILRWKRFYAHQCVYFVYVSNQQIQPVNRSSWTCGILVHMVYTVGGLSTSYSTLIYQLRNQLLTLKNKGNLQKFYAEGIYILLILYGNFFVEDLWKRQIRLKYQRRKFYIFYPFLSVNWTARCCSKLDGKALFH